MLKVRSRDQREKMCANEPDPIRGWVVQGSWRPGVLWQRQRRRAEYVLELAAKPATQQSGNHCESANRAGFQFVTRQSETKKARPELVT